jgi:hypothetical protein
MIGALHATGEEVPTPHTATSFYAAVGTRAGVELPARGRVFARAEAEAAFPLTRVSLQIGGQDVWTVPAVAVRAGAAIGVRF